MNALPVDRTWYKSVLTTGQNGSDPFGRIVNALVFHACDPRSLPIGGSYDGLFDSPVTLALFVLASQLNHTNQIITTGRK